MAQYWRLTGLSTSGNGVLELSELQVYEAGVKVAGTLTCTGGGVLTALTDDLVDAVVSWPYSAYSQSGFALVWDFGATAVVAPSLRLGGGSSKDTFPQDLIMQSSTDGVVWSAYKDAVNVTFPGVLTLGPVPTASGPAPVPVDPLEAFTAFKLDSASLTESHGIALTKTGGITSSTAQTKFNPSAIHNDGTGYISAVLPGGLSGGDFCIEYWEYITTASGHMFNSRTGGGAVDGIDISVVLSVSTDNSFIASGISYYTNTWTHYALTYTAVGTIWKQYANGVLINTNVNNSCTLTGENIRIGGSPYGNVGYLNGYMDGFRITKGHVRYTANFTPSNLGLEYVEPTDSLWANVELLIQGESITDTSKNGLVVTSRGVTLATPPVALFGSALSITGSAGLQIPGGNFGFGSAPFTIEAFIYTASSVSGTIFSCRDSATYCPFEFIISNSTIGILLSNTAQNNWVVVTTPFGLPELTINTWIHIAIVGTGTTLTCYLNGVAGSTPCTMANPLPTPANFYIGKGGDNVFNGYIDNVRVTKAARYTANFTPPTAAFPETGAVAGESVFLPTDELSARARTQTANPSSFPGSALDAFEMYGAPTPETFCDVYDGGVGVIVGTVKEKHIPTNVPLMRRVLLIEQRSQRVIRETWSDASNGYYEFRGIALSTYTVVSFDHTGAYRAVISDSQAPV